VANGAQSLGEALIHNSNGVASAGLHQVREVSRRRTGRVTPTKGRR
jgi:hypothetical protein